MQDRHLLDQGARRHFVAEYGAARLDDEDLVLVHANVGRRALQRAHGDGRIGSAHDHEILRTWALQASMRCSTAICTGRRLKASRLTTARGPSRTSSATATLRRTGRQCISFASGSAPSNQALAHAPVGQIGAQPRIRFGVAVIRGGSPLLGVQHAGAGERRRTIGGFGERAAGRAPPPGARSSMICGGSANPSGPQHHDFHAAHGRHVHRGGRHGQAAVPWDGRPSSRRIWRASRYLELIQGAPVRQCLAGMIHGRFQIDQRFVAQLIDHAEQALVEIAVEILAFGECAHARAHRSTRPAPECPRECVRRQRLS